MSSDVDIPYDGFRVQPLTAALGAEVRDLNLLEVFTNETAASLRRALSEHLVLFFRDQHLDDEHHLALALCFGSPEVPPLRAALGATDPLHDIIDSPTQPPDRDHWHTDLSYLKAPPSVAVVRCEVSPDFGGDTAWANMQLAYEKLSERMQNYLAGLKAFHAPEPSFLQQLRDELSEEESAEVLAALGSGSAHPIVCTHPENGRPTLYIDPAHLHHIEGIPEQESQALCSFLKTRAQDISIQCRFRWTKGAVALWDERSTQHIGVADHRGQHRVLRRLTVAGTAPA